MSTCISDMVWAFSFTASISGSDVACKTIFGFHLGAANFKKGDNKACG